MDSHEKHHAAVLKRLNHVKHSAGAPANPLGPEMVSFFKHSVQKRQNKFAQIATCWTQLVPSILEQHCSLESFHRGTLTVLLDSAPHLFELRQLLLAGLEDQLLLACASSGLRKISLKRGRWYDGDNGQERKLRFS